VSKKLFENKTRFGKKRKRVFFSFGKFLCCTVRKNYEMTKVKNYEKGKTKIDVSNDVKLNKTANHFKFSV
jgi:hypothetical protein